jgi:hypothetical protein
MDIQVHTKTTPIAVLGTQLKEISPAYENMLANISESFPAMMKTSKNFYKSSSQFVMVSLDMTAITPLRSIQHTLAEIEKTKNALEEAYIRTKKNSVQIRQKREAAELCENKFEKELLEIEIEEMELGAKSHEDYIKGAIRKMSYFTEQYNQLMSKLGKEYITEEEYEKEEYKYHIMTAFRQALNAARSRGGAIDEGNLIYMFDLGINGGVAQIAISNYLQAEMALMEKGEIPTHQMTLDWLLACAEEFKNNPESYALWRGLKIHDKGSLTDVSMAGS